MNRGYKHISHTADIKIHAWGRDLPEALSEACRGFTAFYTDPLTIKVQEEKQINIKAKTKESLLYDFITELIYLKDVDAFLPLEAALKVEAEDNAWVLRGTIGGATFRDEPLHGDIKAMTYHDLRLEELSEKTNLEFVLDI